MGESRISTRSGAHCASLIVELVVGSAPAGQAARAITVQVDQGQQAAFVGLFYDRGGPISLRKCLHRTGFEPERRPAGFRLYWDLQGRCRAKLSGPVTIRVSEWGAVTTSGLELLQDPGSSGYWRLPEGEVARLAPPPSPSAGQAGTPAEPVPHWPWLGAAGGLLGAALTRRVRHRRGASAT